MKKLWIVLLIAVAAAGFAEEGIKISGVVFTGVYWEQTQDNGGEKDTDLRLMSKDSDAGSGMGRFRLNLDYENGKGTGISTRFEYDNWNNAPDMKWKFAYGYGNFFDNQLKVSVGKLAGSPWGTGGPEMWKELEENNNGGGMRIEYKPGFIAEEYGKLNVGFVLNWFNSDMDQGVDKNTVEITMLEVFKESVIGISYTHPSFLIRLAYRLDSKLDAPQNNKDDAGGEDELIYRIEERALKNFVPGLQFSAIGDLFGLSAKNKEIQYFRNWAFFDYEPPEMWGMLRPFTAQLRFGHQQTGDADTGIRSEVLVKPSFYWNFLNKLLSIGAAFTYNQDFGKKLTEGSPYQYIEMEPKIQMNFESSYIAFVYCFRREYFQESQAIEGYDPIRQKHWINLRFCIYY